jgi:hypothetical protein
MANGPFRNLAPIASHRQQEPPDELPQGEFQGFVLGALERLGEGQEKLFLGQTELTVAFGKLAPRVAQLEESAKWKARAITLAKALAPFVGGLVVARFPQLASVVGDILKAIGTAAASGGVPLP